MLKKFTKTLTNIYIFLASVYFAIILIASAALFVIAGTFIESATKSHLYAASIVYENPLFDLILAGFFINILFSALRRWPFKFRHIPFLITHLGLLMIISGVIIKLHFGVQGALHLVEGSGSHEIFETNTYALSLQSRFKKKSTLYPLTSSERNKKSKLIGEENGWVLRLNDYTPNSTEVLSSWVKGSFASISGLKPQPVVEFKADNLSSFARVKFSTDGPEFDFYALHTDDLEAAIKALYCKDSKVSISKSRPQQFTQQFILKDLINSAKAFEDDKIIQANLSIPISLLNEVVDPKLTISINNQESVSVPLSGQSSLDNINLLTPYLGKAEIAVDIETKQTFALIQDSSKDVHMIIIDCYGHIKTQKFEEGTFNSLLSYDNGFGGYGTKIDDPFEGCFFSRHQKKQALAFYLHQHILKANESSDELIMPLKFFKEACHNQNLDFAECLTLFLLDFNSSHSWLYPKNHELNPKLIKVFNDASWKMIPLELQKGNVLTETFFNDLSEDLENGINPYELLVKGNWPLIDTFSKEEIENPKMLLTKITEQIFSAASFSSSLPSIQNSELGMQLEANTNVVASHFSSLLKVYHIDYDYLINSENQTLALSNDNIEFSNNKEALDFSKKEPLILSFPTYLETEIVPYHKDAMPTRKIEDNTPCILLSATKGKSRKKISLRYDKTGKGLKWPILDGEYLARFQPNTISIPYHVRLRQARQINYPNSKQAYSYESDLIIQDLRSKQEVEKTISMNDVHETWDGYRFYLSSISGDDSSLKHIQVIVNRDIAKYWLTYPGGIILTCGILALFFMRSFRKS